MHIYICAYIYVSDKRTTFMLPFVITFTPEKGDCSCYKHKTKCEHQDLSLLLTRFAPAAFYKHKQNVNSMMLVISDDIHWEKRLLPIWQEHVCQYSLDKGRMQPLSRKTKCATNHR